MKKIPFPQANNLQLIYKIFCDIDSMGMNKFDIQSRYKLAEREGSYYLDALYYLGFVDKIRIKYFLNHKGILFNKLSDEDRKSEFINLIVHNDFLGDLYKCIILFDSNKEKKEYIAGRIANKEKLGINTAQRRASTIISWFIWIDKNK
ncbi:DUF7226 domain-containing protein [Clostridium tagluense]|uniref:DUF7226 domain-containing protein n=1 Tax=Clostridium tagluense TaxID=360422 RepID=UPI001C0D1D92|nr:hypothetical protein [Clostridium tagluense]MBU3129010.1 hypothetical protein [Clostridium tagluense]